MSARNGNPGLTLYTPPSRKMLAGWTMTPAQMDLLVGTYRNCQAEATKIADTGRLAVIRYRPQDRPAPRSFFRNQVTAGSST